MNILTSTAARLRRIQQDMPYLIRLVVVENATLLEDMNISQLQRGQRADGITLPDYSERSVREFGKPPGPIRLYDTGAFYRAMNVQVIGKVIDFGNTDRKALKLVERYGEPILGLSAENQDYFSREILRPELIKKIKERLFPLR